MATFRIQYSSEVRTVSCKARVMFSKGIEEVSSYKTITQLVANASKLSEYQNMLLDRYLEKIYYEVDPYPDYELATKMFLAFKALETIPFGEYHINWEDI